MTDDKLSLNSNLAELRGVGPVLNNHLITMGLSTISDLINNYPRKYNDYSFAKKICQLKPGLVTLEAKISDVTQRRVRRGLHITEALAYDTTGSMKLTWFNQPYRASSIKNGSVYLISGEFGLQKERLQIINPSVELVKDFALVKKQKEELIVPVYRESKHINSTILRKLIEQVLPFISQQPEILPKWMIDDNNLMPFGLAIKSIHAPLSQQQLTDAKRRLAFEELFILIMASDINRGEVIKEKSPNISFELDLAKNFIKKLPYELTVAQKKTIWQIYNDMTSNKIGIKEPTIKPMNRLVEGDVGSGKTVVAAMASLMAVNSTYQVAVVAPTALLAQQHMDTFSELFKNTPIEKNIELLTSSTKGKTLIKQQVKKGEISILIGTHALMQKDVAWHKLGLIIIDEQHRFGVQQRQKLHTSTKIMPHVLCLTATPIPRSLALTVYGELDISIIDESPVGRLKTQTQIISPNSKKQMYQDVEKELLCGRQAYIVCPLISESDILQVSSAEKIYKELSTTYLREFRVALLHGRLKADQKEKLMNDFKLHKIDVLVATTVIEVGVDVPNATVMIVESADRFGLAQLHQLRGRVGRGNHQSYCYLVLSDSKMPPKRLQALTATNNGFELAELDLQIRGPGAIYGLQQHGALDLRIASLTDTSLIYQAKLAVEEFRKKGENLLEYKQIAQKVLKAANLTYLN